MDAGEAQAESRPMGRRVERPRRTWRARRLATDPVAGGRSGGRRRARNRDDGVALVEFALVAPVLFLVLFGIIEFGMGLNDYQSIRHGVREGARQAVVQTYGSAPTDCTTVVAPTDVKKVICLTKERIGLGAETRVRVAYTAGVPEGDSDEVAANPDHGSVNVCAQRALQPLTGAIPGLDSIHLKSSIAMRMEKAIGDAIAAELDAEFLDTGGDTVVWAEEPPTGGNWNGC